MVGDVGVITGAHGDLEGRSAVAVGLADEDAADAGWGQHQPLRLSVVAYADETAIQRIVAESATLSALVGNEWVSITAVGSPVDGRARELRPDLRWRRSRRPRRAGRRRRRPTGVGSGLPDL